MNTLSKALNVGFEKRTTIKKTALRKEKSKPTDKAQTTDIHDFYRAHWKGLCAFLRKRYGDGPPDPEDVAQEAFYQLANMGCRAHITHPKAFLYKISVNITLAARKSERWLTDYLPDSNEGLDQELLSYAEPDKIFHNQQTLQHLGGIFDGLTEKQKYVVHASRIDGKTYQQIADETGWSVADICRQLKSALSALTATLNHDE